VCVVSTTTDSHAMMNSFKSVFSAFAVALASSDFVVMDGNSTNPNGEVNPNLDDARDINRLGRPSLSLSSKEGMLEWVAEDYFLDDSANVPQLALQEWNALRENVFQSAPENPYSINF